MRLKQTQHIVLKKRNGTQKVVAEEIHWCLQNNPFEQVSVAAGAKRRKSQRQPALLSLRLPSPSELCATFGYITNKPYKLPDGHLLVISETELTTLSKFQAVLFLPCIIIEKIFVHSFG